MLIKNFLRIKNEIDFVNVDVDKDNVLFIDPVRIMNSNDSYLETAKSTLESYFANLIKNYYEDKDAYGKMFSHLQERKESRLGYSQKSNIFGKGTGQELSKTLADGIADAIEKFPVIFKSFDEIPIFAKGVSDDRISDMITNICFNTFVKYTNDICKHYNYNLKRLVTNWYWNVEKAEWDIGQFELPIINGYEMIFIPKEIICKKIALRTFNELIQFGFLGYCIENYETMEFQHLSRVVGKDEQSRPPFKKAIREYYLDKGIDIFDIKNFENFSEEEQENALKFYKKYKLN